MSDATNSQPAEQWAIVELKGHLRLAGRLTQVDMFGSPMGRLDVPNGDTFATKLFHGSSVYAISYVDEAAARAVAAQAQVQPVHSWEMARQLPAAPRGGYGGDDDGDDDGDGRHY